MRKIVHLDADAFFAAVEQASDPKLRGKPIAVGGEKRGIIASASYEARKFGVYTPMPTVRARKLCPKLIVVPGDYERYEQFSKWMFGYCYDFTPDVEQTSIDEGYFDLSCTRKPAIDIALTIRQAIGQKLKISVSEGIATNKLVSAIASKLSKPHAFQEIPPGTEVDFLHSLPNKWLPGIGQKTSVRLNAAGLAEIRHIAATPVSMLELLLGSQAHGIHQYAHGIDERPLILASEPQKTYSTQQTFSADITDEAFAEAILKRMADDLFATVRAEHRSVRTLTVKVRYNDMDEDQTSESFKEPTDLEADVYSRLGILLRSAWKRRVSLRLVSLKLSNVYASFFQPDLSFRVTARNRLGQMLLMERVDELRHRHGRAVVMRGHDFILKNPPKDAIGKERPVARQKVSAQRSPHVANGYVPLRCHSYFSFLDSTLSPKALVTIARQQKLKSLALTDSGNLHGAAEFVQAANEAGIKPIVGVEVALGLEPLLLYVETARGYENLCRLLSKRSIKAADADEGSVARQQRKPFSIHEIEAHAEGLIAVSSATRIADIFPNRFYELVGKRKLNESIAPVACPPIHFHRPKDRTKYDILQSIRTLTLLSEHHAEKRSNGKLHFRLQAEMAEACKDNPAWIRNTFAIAERCTFEMQFGKPQFPAFHPGEGSTASEFLKRLVLDGLNQRYSEKARDFRKQVMEELAIIGDVGYEEYFLITWDFLQECKRRGIEWITRGSAADSLVCYCLGISGVCPIRFDLYFRRFLNKERMALNKLPDIDIDFPHDRKDDVIDLLFEKYGPEHCAVVGGFSTFQSKSAFAEIAKVLGVSEREIRKFTDRFPWSFGSSYEPAGFESEKLMKILEESPETRDLPIREEPYRTALETAQFLDSFPRYPKMHPCGVVLSRQPMHELTPTFIANKGYATTHFDMDSVEDVGLIKMDILAQGGLAAMRDVKAMLSNRGIDVDLEKCVAYERSTGRILHGNPNAAEPWTDPEVWKMIARGEGRAVHHIESPAMTSLCKMCDVREIDGLIAIVSVIRPGAANEGKKLSFTRRYQGLEEVSYPHPSLESCLRSTYGLVVYEEHILQMSEAFAGISPGRADVLRKALNKHNTRVIEQMRVEFFDLAAKRGHTPEKIEEVWALVTGFAGYAFCKAHSTAYGVEAYQSAWLKQYFPIEFMTAVLSNGKGFYHPLVYVLECHRMKIKLLPPSVNEPGPAFVRHGKAIRCPLTRVKGLTDKTIQSILNAAKPILSMAHFYEQVQATGEELEAMIRVGAFDEFGESRTRQFWRAQQLVKTHEPGRDQRQAWLIPPPGMESLPEIALKEPTRLERLAAETELLDFAVSGHPLELFPDVHWESYCPVSRLIEHVGEEVVTCGLIVEQRIHHQVTGEPMKFLSLADWTGIVETELFSETYRRYGLATVRFPVLEVRAKVESFDNKTGFSLRVLSAGPPRQLVPPHPDFRQTISSGRPGSN
jgi:DNA-directed DNA polymerase III PolC